MTEDQKKKFELINNSLWLLLKAYVKDDKPYKTIMSEFFKGYIEKTKLDNKFSDEWWDKVIVHDFMTIADKYKGTEYEDFAARFGMGFCDYWELEMKNKSNYLEFYKCMSKAFVKEWEKLHGKTEKKTA